MVLVENDGASFNALAENAKRLGANQLQIVKDDAIEFLRIAKGRFDVVFLDPPFRRGVDGELLQLVERVLAATGSVYVESDAAFSHPDWRVVRHSRAGQVHFHLLQRAKEFSP